MGTRILSLLIAMTALTFGTSAPAVSGYVSGNDLLGTCNPAQADPVYRLKVAECRGYVIGIADTFDCTTQASGFKWNSATGSSQRDLVEVVVDWLKQHPQHLGYQANGLVAAALSEAFPCGRRSASTESDETASTQ